MNNILADSLNLIEKAINLQDFKNNDIYSDILGMLSSILNHDSSVGIFFLENTDFILKSALKNSEPVEKYSIDKNYILKLLSKDDSFIKLKTKPDDFLNENTIIIKLAIRSSVFGFFVYSSNKEISEYLETSLLSIISIISYKIKDFELNEVFKIQLKAMQDAIIEREEAYNIIKKQHKKLTELDKTKTLFLANISHELRTPLNAIIGFSQALSSKIFGELNEKQTEYINDIQISSLHLLGMINEILDISKLEARAMKFTPTEISPNQTIQEVINILQPLYKNKNIKVEFNSKYNGLIKADYQKIQQILYNLLSNAIKFTPENGTITINSSAKDKNYFLSVADNGVGIDKKYHNKIFKKFVHLNNLYVKNQSSTGLGLTITKELVKLHNGKITLTSELNKGTTFNMEFKNILI